MLARAFPNASVTGLDFSAPAIAEARKQYPDRRFEHSPDGAIDRAYDVIVTSNCLEHFADPFEVARSHLRRCGYLYIVLVPFEERQRHESHLFTFERSSFPDRIEGFTKLDAQAIETVERYWPGSQILTIYGSRRYLDEYN
jgi:trans-aconitate methyltransferase